jgi:hypothetical protein
MKRRWFQIHLSTAVVLMLAAGILLWANIGRSREYIVDYDFTRTPPLPILNSYVSYGWPVSAELGPPSILFVVDGSGINLPIELPRTNYARAWLNVPIALALLMLMCVACEHIVGRREAPKL